MQRILDCKWAHRTLDLVWVEAISVQLCKGIHQADMISKTRILHERDASFQSQWPFRVDETLLFEMCRPFKNELLKKNVVSRRQNAHFFVHPDLS